jgi:ketosteroid isomerase-like protein
MPEESTPPDAEEAVRRAVAAFIRRDFDNALSIWGPDGIWDASPLGIGVFEGQEAIRGFFEDWREAFEDFEQDVEEFVDLGGVTFGLIFQTGRPIGTGASGHVQFRYAAVSTWANGLIERSTIYTEADIDQARATAERLAEERS